MRNRHGVIAEATPHPRRPIEPLNLDIFEEWYRCGEEDAIELAPGDEVGPMLVPPGDGETA